MNSKLLFKVGFLFVCLVVALNFRNLVSSLAFQNDLNDLFTSKVKTMRWCPDHVVDFEWLDSSTKFQTWKNANPKELEKIFCSLKIEPVAQVDGDGEFSPLLRVQSAEARTAVLEWNSERQLFRVQDMVFGSHDLMGKEK